jgi:uncharacterized protein (DUF1330 family)
MAKGYWVVKVDVTDPQGHAAYRAEVVKFLEANGGRFVVRGGTAETVEGTSRARTVVVEFADYATALACYRSAEYQRIAALRFSSSEADFVVVEGYDDPPPG